VHVLHAGTALRDDVLVSAGGRVLTVVGTGPTLSAARATAYAGVDRIGLDGGQHRGDIAARAAQQAEDQPVDPGPSGGDVPDADAGADRADAR
ncbi:MAG: hypothetical protein KJ548_09860, partial [Actinobacteria bacterium]|nr:hypothetical protein [Actinomycetota bacterium]